jgi:hypothetical protein
LKLLAVVGERRAGAGLKARRLVIENDLRPWQSVLNYQ